jgi:hypothetical protein
MDPLTTLSLASAVVQFVDFGISILKAGNEVYHSVSNSSEQLFPYSDKFAGFDVPA